MSVETPGEAAIGTWRSGRGRRRAKSSPPDVPHLRRRPRHRLAGATLHQTSSRTTAASASRDFLHCTRLLAPRRRFGTVSELLRLRQVPADGTFVTVSATGRCGSTHAVGRAGAPVSLFDSRPHEADVDARMSSDVVARPQRRAAACSSRCVCEASCVLRCDSTVCPCERLYSVRRERHRAARPRLRWTINKGVFETAC